MGSCPVWSVHEGRTEVNKFETTKALAIEVNQNIVGLEVSMYKSVPL